MLMNNVTMNLSQHFTLGELTKTKSGIKNVPNEAQVENLRRVCRWLEQLRRRWNNLYGDGDDPIIINSGFRSPEVNRAVGGSATSNHLTGCGGYSRGWYRAAVALCGDIAGYLRLEQRGL